MPKIYLDNIRHISYKKIENNPLDSKYIVFLHGLMSNMNGKKSLHIQNFCKKNKLNFFTFDNLGHGDSWGNFIEQNISIWIDSFKKICQKLLKNHKLILVGSSMGGWIALLFAIYKQNIVSALLLLAPAPDFTDDVWSKLKDVDKKGMIKDGYLTIKNLADECKEGYKISYDLIMDGKSNLILNQEKIDLNIPISIIHGLKDQEVDPKKSMKIAEKISSQQISIQYIKNATHNLSTMNDLFMIENALSSLLLKLK